MKILVAGASGNTGRLLVSQLLERGHQVVAIVRSPDTFRSKNGFTDDHPLTTVGARILDLSQDKLQDYLVDCNGIASCLGHNLTFNGIFGHPRRLVTDAVRNLCQAAIDLSRDQPMRFVLMNTAGNVDRQQGEQVSFAQNTILRTLRLIVPPHPDNEQAAGFLQNEIGKNHESIEWSVVRPDSLIDQEAVTPYQIHSSPTRSAIFDPGKTSRINVAHFMAELLTSDAIWQQWQAKMPVIYNE